MISINNLNLVNANLLEFFVIILFLCHCLSSSLAATTFHIWSNGWENTTYKNREHSVQWSPLSKPPNCYRLARRMLMWTVFVRCAQNWRLLRFVLFLACLCGKFNFNWNFLMFWKAFCCKMTSKNIDQILNSHWFYFYYT